MGESVGRSVLVPELVVVLVPELEPLQVPELVPELVAKLPSVPELEPELVPKLPLVPRLQLESRRSISVSQDRLLAHFGSRNFGTRLDIRKWILVHLGFTY